MAVKSEPKNKMTRQEAGRLGGEKVAEERGAEFYRKIGRKGGENRRSRTTTMKGEFGVASREKSLTVNR